MSYFAYTPIAFLHNTVCDFILRVANPILAVRSFLFAMFVYTQQQQLELAKYKKLVNATACWQSRSKTIFKTPIYFVNYFSLTVSLTMTKPCRYALRSRESRGSERVTRVGCKPVLNSWLLKLGIRVWGDFNEWNAFKKLQIWKIDSEGTWKMIFHVFFFYFATKTSSVTLDR